MKEEIVGVGAEARQVTPAQLQAGAEIGAASPHSGDLLTIRRQLEKEQEQRMLKAFESIRVKP